MCSLCTCLAGSCLTTLSPSSRTLALVSLLPPPPFLLPLPYQGMGLCTPKATVGELCTEDMLVLGDRKLTSKREREREKERGPQETKGDRERETRRDRERMSTQIRHGSFRVYHGTCNTLTRHLPPASPAAAAPQVPEAKPTGTRAGATSATSTPMRVRPTRKGQMRVKASWGASWSASSSASSSWPRPWAWAGCCCTIR